MDTVEGTLKAIEPRRRYVLMSRHGIGGFTPMLQREIAEVLGVSRQMVFSLEKRAMQDFKAIYRPT